MKKPPENESQFELFHDIVSPLRSSAPFPTAVGTRRRGALADRRPESLRAPRKRAGSHSMKAVDKVRVHTRSPPLCLYYTLRDRFPLSGCLLF
ncbi:hypothetical protein SKAU_G00065800 [Synaphobranchus kaupii]|uniref:Uncharacterized protein n=1 Tax=Synaphobranchus kaupii TaxID=118154 RepID=A0A9Q1G606_SYNKA|nr:hypothetical protein SKAU_G00065800 [Synaphobranchus kaupii]